MKVSFVVDSAIVGENEVKLVVGKDPDRVIRIGDKVGGGSKIAETNYCRYDLGDFDASSEVNSAMVRFLDEIEGRAAAIYRSYKYFHVPIEIGYLEEDFSISRVLIEKMRSLEVQIDIEITRY